MKRRIAALAGALAAVAVSAAALEIVQIDFDELRSCGRQGKGNTNHGCRCLPVGEYEVPKGHPRILFDKERLEEVRKRMKEDPAVGGYYKRLEETFLPKCRTSQWNPNPWLREKQVQTIAFLHCLKPNEHYAKALRFFMEECSKDYAKHKNKSLVGQFANAMAYGLDWAYDEFTPEERKRYAKVIVKATDYLHGENGHWRHSEFNGWFGLYSRSIVAALAVWGESGDEAAERRLIENAIGYNRTHQFTAMVAAAGPTRTGAWILPGMGYASGWPGKMWTSDIYMRAFKCQDLWQEIGASSRNMARAYVYLRRPFDGGLVQCEDYGRGKGGRKLSSGSEGACCAMATGMWKDRYAAMILKEIGRPTYGYDLIPYIVWLDTKVEPYKKEELPLSSFFDTMNWYAMRSDWTKDAVYAMFQSSDRLAGHQHLDNGSFVIHKKAPLLIDSGDYNGWSGQPIDGNYQSRTIAHNCILIFDPNENHGRSRVNDGGQRGWYYSRANDSGSHPKSACEYVAKDSPWDIATTTGLEAKEGLFDYMSTEYHKAYDPKKVPYISREFLYLRPDVFVVFDRVKSSNPGFKKSFLLHTVKRPELTLGGRPAGEAKKVEVAGHVETYTADGALVVNGGGQVRCYTVIPEKPDVRVVGGKGHEVYSGGKNWPSKNGWNEQMGAWRLEISPAESRAYDHFLHVFHVTDAGSAEKISVEKVERPGVVGVKVTGADRVFEVTFKAGEEAGGRLKIAEGDNVLHDGALATELRLPRIPWMEEKKAAGTR